MKVSELLSAYPALSHFDYTGSGSDNKYQSLGVGVTLEAMHPKGPQKLMHFPPEGKKKKVIPILQTKELKLHIIGGRTAFEPTSLGQDIRYRTISWLYNPCSRPATRPGFLVATAGNHGSQEAPERNAQRCSMWNEGGTGNIHGPPDPSLEFPALTFPL